MSADIKQQKYQPLSSEQKLKVREVQFQLTQIKEQAAAAIKQVEQNLFNIVQSIGTENGIPKDAKVEFQMTSLEFTDRN